MHSMRKQVWVGTVRLRCPAPRSSGATRAFDHRGLQEFRPLLRGRGRRKGMDSLHP